MQLADFLELLSRAQKPRLYRRKRLLDDIEDRFRRKFPKASKSTRTCGIAIGFRTNSSCTGPTGPQVEVLTQIAEKFRDWRKKTRTGRQPRADFA
jgi:hypothetical protein